MKNTIICLFIIVASNYCFGQPAGYYFKDITKATFSTNDDVNKETIISGKDFGLQVLNHSVDSITTNTYIWRFSDVLSISIYNTVTKTENVILTCNYSDNIDKRVIKFIVEEKEVAYSYNPVATGRYIYFLKKKEKKKRSKK